MKCYKKILIILLLTIIYLWAWFQQNHFIFTSDVSWLIHATTKFLSGGSYSRDFLETNPPLILYLYIPVVVLVKSLALSTYIALRIYIFLLISLSLYLCHKLLEKIIKPSHDSFRFFLLLMMALCLLIIPFSDFGQREHLLVIFTLPYILLLAARLQCPHQFSLKFIIGVGCLAALGFCIKPYFFITFMLIEAYYCWKKQSWRGWLRAEVMSIIFVAILYMLAISLFNRDYLTFILPLATHFYWSLYQQPLLELLLSDESIFFYCSVVLYLTTLKKNPYASLTSLLFLSSSGFWLCYLIPQITWYYHVLPNFILTTLTVTCTLSGLLTQQSLSRREFISTSIFAALFFCYLITKLTYIFDYSVADKKLYNNFLTALTPYQQQSFTIFSTDSLYAFPTIDYINMSYSSRFWNLAWLPGMKDPLAINSNPQFYQQHQAELDFYLKLIVQDFNRYRPQLVFIDRKGYDHNHYFGHAQINYISLFSHNPQFKQVWNNYKYLKTIISPPLYNFDIYTRKNS